MKLKSAVAITLLFLISISASAAHAGNVKMIFWYPGEAGSTAEAAPVLDAFFKYVGGKMTPDAVTGKYFNVVPDGVTYIKREQPAVGIVSYAAWVQNRDKISGADVILSTIPLPGGASTERYALVGRDGKPAAGWQILSSEPLGVAFVRGELFPDLPASANIQATAQLIAKLKDIGEGKLNATAILTPTEAATLAKLSAPWAKALKVITESKPVPTARVVLFDQGWKGAAKFKAALVASGSDPAARDILQEMRLKGFAE
ncbi:MAG: hypothetical protein V2A66_06215 [Pseudomonadota bacterium]